MLYYSKPPVPFFSPLTYCLLNFKRRVEPKAIKTPKRIDGKAIPACILGYNSYWIILIQLNFSKYQAAAPFLLVPTSPSLNVWSLILGFIIANGLMIGLVLVLSIISNLIYKHGQKRYTQLAELININNFQTILEKIYVIMKKGFKIQILALMVYLGIEIFQLLGYYLLQFN